MKFILLFIVGFTLAITRSCGGQTKSEDRIFRETLDSMATESSFFLNSNDSLKNDSFTANH